MTFEICVVCFMHRNNCVLDLFKNKSCLCREKKGDMSCKGDMKTEQVGFTRSEQHFIFELQLELDYVKNRLCHQSIVMTYKLPQV